MIQQPVITNELRVGDVEPGQLVTIRARMVEQVGPQDTFAPRVALFARSFVTGRDVIVAVDPDARCTVEVIAAS